MAGRPSMKPPTWRSRRLLEYGQPARRSSTRQSDNPWSGRFEPQHAGDLMTGARFAGQAVLVTGAGSGFGRATALGFAREGAAWVGLVERDSERLAAVARAVEADG